MTNNETRDTGIPTRAIHESYLDMQRAHREYRRVRDNPQQNEKPAHAGFQEAVLTFYELIRPHLKRKSGMGTFWDGELPEYPNQPWDSVEQAKHHCTQYGTAVWALQKHVQTVGAPSSAGGAAGESGAIADGGGSLKDWHNELGLTDKQRIVALDHKENIVTWVELRPDMGLKRLDTWDTREKRMREQQDGFMAGEATTTVELRHMAIWKLTKAKRLLAEAADKMSLLSRVDIDHEDGAIVNFDQSREDANPEYRTADYNSSPDI